ncbi:nucleotidyl transferase AbiEii/AbiGii toxin family protein [Maribellus mangrovi]|uniref:nucleotidyl transferase AbiEii/AbiGii toxin family protein n=1 Tax=Maribellus mangrovi TaxID=3133146 RepID=UPI0030EE4585
MLFYNTVSDNTLKLIRRLMNDPLLDSFILVDGTALSLQIGHRISIDIDLFTSENFDAPQLMEHLKQNYSFEADFLAKNTIKGEIESTKIDCIRHGYPWLEPSQMIEDIRIASLSEISAMKLNAITTNGTRLKDFIDIAYLSPYLSLNQMLDAYELKYRNNRIMGLKSLLYFDDIDFSEPIQMLASSGAFRWETIKSRIILMQDQPDKQGRPI